MDIDAIPIPGEIKPEKSKSSRTEDNRRIKEFETTQLQRQMVIFMKGCGVDHEGIALQIGCSKSTLEKKFKAELNTGKNWLHGRASIKAVTMALSGDRAMLSLLLKTQFGWRESGRVEHTGANGGAIQLETLANEQLHSLLASLGEGKAPKRRPGGTGEA